LNIAPFHIIIVIIMSLRLFSALFRVGFSFIFQLWCWSAFSTHLYHSSQSRASII